MDYEMMRAIERARSMTEEETAWRTRAICVTDKVPADKVERYVEFGLAILRVMRGEESREESDE